MGGSGRPRRWCAVTAAGLAADTPAEVVWNEGANQSARHLPLGEVPSLDFLVGRAVWMLLPGEGIMQAFLKPPRPGRYAKAALPWLLEPLLLNEVGDNDLVWRRDAAAGDYRVWVCSQEWRSSAASCLADMGFPQLALVPWHGLLPRSSGAGVVQRIVGIHCFSDSAGSGLLPPDARPGGEAEQLPDIDDLASLSEWALERLFEAPLPALTLGDRDAAPSSRVAFPIAACAAWLALAVGIALDTADVKRQTEALAARNLEQARAAAPGMALNARNWRARLARAANLGDAGPLAATATEPVTRRLDRLAQAVAQSGVPVRVEQLDYREEAVVLAVGVPVLEDASALRRALEAAGHTAELRLARGQAGRVVADLHVELPPWSG